MTVIAQSSSPRTRDAIGAALAVALLVSLVVHLGMIVSFVDFGGRPRAGGEAGHGGAGDVTMDITVEGPRATQLQPAVAALPPPAPPTPELDVPRAPTPHPAAVRTPALSVPSSAVSTSSVPAASSTPEAPAARPSTPAATAPAMGTDASDTSGGRARGAAAVRALILGSAGFMPTSVEGQRALLPAATTCDDPVAGVWRALKYSPTFGGQWVRFTLLIRRGENDALVGSIRSRIWSGTPSERVPPPCSYGHIDTTHAMVAQGRVSGEHISFGSHTYRLVTDHCPQLFAASTHGYAPDNFSGTLDTMRQEFQSVNNDGAFDINTPYVFRRVGCLEERETAPPDDEE